MIFVAVIEFGWVGRIEVGAMVDGRITSCRRPQTGNSVGGALSSRLML